MSNLFSWFSPSLLFLYKEDEKFSNSTAFNLYR